MLTMLFEMGLRFAHYFGRDHGNVIGIYKSRFFRTLYGIVLFELLFGSALCLSY